MTTPTFLDAPPRFLFFTGKGGVGKTSLACATATALASRGKPTLLVSTDPASNISQVFGTPIGSQLTPVADVHGLTALEIDPHHAADKYREKVIGPLRGVAPAAEVRAAQEQLSGSCTTEIASFHEFATLLADDTTITNFEHVVFDTAPTGHTIRLLQLPGQWASFLETGKGDASCLGPMAGLDASRSTYESAVERLADPATTRLILVARAQRASLDVAARTSAELGDTGMRAQHLAINAVLPREAAADDPVAHAVYRREQQALDEMPPQLTELPRTVVPLKPATVVGLDAVLGLFAHTNENYDDASAAVQIPDAADVAGLRELQDLVNELDESDHGLVMCLGKGGVGKTTVAQALAVALAARGNKVHLTSTDPAALETSINASTIPNLQTSRIDPQAVTEKYRARVIASKGKDMGDDELAALREDLASPCTEEVAVFGEFSHLVNAARRQFVIMDTAPTGHTLLLMDTTGSYHRDIARTMGDATNFTTPLMRLQDSQFSKLIIVTLPDTTPVLEAEQLQQDLRRADIEPWAWVVNASLSQAEPTSALLAARAAAEFPHLRKVTELSDRVAAIPLLRDEPQTVEQLHQMTQSAAPKQPHGARW